MFWLVAAVSLREGWRSGGGRERVLIGAVLISLFATVVVSFALPTILAAPAIIAIDATLAAAALIVAFYSERFWPLWFSAFAFVGCLTNATLFYEMADYWLLRMMAGFWAIPALFVMLAGSVRDRSLETEDRASAGVV